MNVKEYVLVPKNTYEELLERDKKYTDLILKKDDSNIIDKTPSPVPENYMIPALKEATDIPKIEVEKADIPNKVHKKSKKKNPEWSGPPNKIQKKNKSQHTDWVLYK